MSIDGFQAEDQFIFLILREGIVYEAILELNNSAPFTNTYATNGFGQIINLSIGDQFIEDCIGPPVGSDCDGNSIEVIEHEFEKTYIINTVDIFGRTIHNNSHQNLQIRIYSNGLIEKKYFLSH